LQSQVPEVTEITLLLSMLTTVPRLQRLPSLKDMAKGANLTEMPLGLLSYPVLQSADIILPMAHIVPVGKDNEAHIELTRELVLTYHFDCYRKWYRKQCPRYSPYPSPIYQSKPNNQCTEV
jgi:tryptophanyl-tRNA synthetase